MSDLTIFRKGFDWHENASEKEPGDIVLSDHGSLWSQFPIKWAILTDKRYVVPSSWLEIL